MSGYVWAPWQGATDCTDGPTDGARHLLAWLLESFPAGSSLGIYNCRTVRGGATTSLHGEGRAVDYAMPRDPDGTGSAAGRAIVDRLGPHGLRLGIQAVIYDRTIWSARSPAGRYYTGTHPHYDHLHVELTWAAARALNLATLRAVAGGPEEGEMYVIRHGQGIRSGVTGDLGDPFVRYCQARWAQMGYDLGDYGPNGDGIDGKYGGTAAGIVDAICREAGLPEEGATGYHVLALSHFERRWALRFAGGEQAAPDLSGYLTTAAGDKRYERKGHGHPAHDHPVTVDGRTGKG